MINKNLEQPTHNLLMSYKNVTTQYLFSTANSNQFGGAI